jgi:putative intracellular protease/amidase
LNKPIAAICHGPWTPIDADIAKGKQLLRTRLKRTMASLPLLALQAHRVRCGA